MFTVSLLFFLRAQVDWDHIKERIDECIIVDARLNDDNACNHMFPDQSIKQMTLFGGRTAMTCTVYDDNDEVIVRIWIERQVNFSVVAAHPRPVYWPRCVCTKSNKR